MKRKLSGDKGGDEVDSCTIYDLQDSEFDEENVAVCVEL